MSDNFTEMLNVLVYGAPPAKEVSAKDDWDYLITNNPEAPGHYYRYGDGNNIRVYSDHVNITLATYEWKPNEKAIAELKALMASWRANGWGALADEVETRTEEGEDAYEEVAIYESLGESVEHKRVVRIPLSDVRFYKEMSYPTNGLAEIVREPRSNGRLTGLSTVGMNY